MNNCGEKSKLEVGDRFADTDKSNLLACALSISACILARHDDRRRPQSQMKLKRGNVSLRKNNSFRMTVKISVEDHERLSALSALLNKSMHVIVTDWIHEHLDRDGTPNAATLKAIESIEHSRNLVEAKDAPDMFRKLAI